MIEMLLRMIFGCFHTEALSARSARPLQMTPVGSRAIVICRNFSTLVRVCVPFVAVCISYILVMPPCFQPPGTCMGVAGCLLNSLLPLAHAEIQALPHTTSSSRAVHTSQCLPARPSPLTQATKSRTLTASCLSLYRHLPKNIY
jgi:hypothetical protein